jgi:hypothetical protein
MKHQTSLRRHQRLSTQGKLARCKPPGTAVTRVPKSRFYDPANDNYETPLWAWREFFVAVPSLRKNLLWDPFYCSGATTHNWKTIGVARFIHKPVDFFTTLPKIKYDVVVTNPPYSTKQLVVAALVGTGKPFVVLLRMNVLFARWFRQLVPVFKLVLPSKAVNSRDRARKYCHLCACSFVSDVGRQRKW